MKTLIYKSIIIFIVSCGILNSITNNIHAQACVSQRVGPKILCKELNASCSPPQGGTCQQTATNGCDCIAPRPDKPSQTNKSKWKEQNGYIQIPSPGYNATYTFTLDTTYQYAYSQVELNKYFGGGIIQTSPIGGTITVLASRRLSSNEQDTIDISLISYSLEGKSIYVPGLGETGINYLTYDSLKGIFDINSGNMWLVGKGRITNNLFPSGAPATFITYQWGTVNINNGEVIQYCIAFDNLPVLCEKFTDNIFPPEDWNLSYTGTSYWIRNSVSSFGVGSGSARFNFWIAPPGTTQSMITNNILNTVSGDTLRFDYAYAPFTTGTDSLIIETSSDHGLNYSTLVRLYGRAGGGTLNTAPTSTILFIPTSSQWATKKYVVPAGTNKVKFRAKSGYGNNLFLDSIYCGIQFESLSSVNYSFNSQISGTTNQLYSISAVSEMIGWAAGSAATVRKTTDGGVTWTNATGTGITGSVYNINALDANTAFCTTSPSATFIYKTTNGGTTWSQVFTQSEGFIDAIQMISQTDGYALGDPVGGKWTLLKTTDAGNNWTRMSTEPPQINSEAGWNNSLCIKGSNIWFGTNATRVYHSTDLGLTWTYGSTTGTVNSYAIHYNNSSTGMAGGNGLVISTNGGTSYTQITSPGTTGYVNGIEGSGTEWWSIRSGANIYRSTNAGINWIIFHIQTGTVFQDIDLDPSNKGWAVGSGGTIVKMSADSPPSNTLSLNLTAYIQGLYSSSTNSILSDTVQVYLSNTTPPYSKADSAKAYLSISGTGTLVFYNAPPGTYYIVLKNRNSINTWSTSGGISITSGVPVSYNFTTSSSQAFGNNQIQVDNSPLRFAIYSGDVNQDGVVDLSDVTLIDNAATIFTSGYVNTDLNGDWFVDLSDLIIADNNSYNYVSAITPGSPLTIFKNTNYETQKNSYKHKPEEGLKDNTDVKEK